VPVCLSGTIRSRSFSPPQRFEPARASWLCFAPHPPIGFRPPEPFPLGQPRHLSMPVALLPFRLAPASTRVTPRFHPRPHLAPFPHESSEVRPRITVFARATLTTAPGICRATAHRSASITRRAAWTADRVSARRAHSGASGSAKGRSERRPIGLSLRLQSLAPTESPFSSPRG